MNAAPSSSGRTFRPLWIPPALLLIAAALGKAQEPLSFLLELSNYGFHLPPTSEALVALLLPVLEMFLGGFLLFGNSRLAAGASAALLLFFSYAILAALPGGYLHRCGCLGPEKVGATLALVKNGVAIALLVLGFLPFARRGGKANPWGAFGIILGGLSTSLMMSGFVGATVLMSGFAGKVALIALLAGLALGLALKLLGFPFIALLVAGFVLYLFAVEERKPSAQRAWGLAAITAVICFLKFIYPAAPQHLQSILRVGDPLPPSLISAGTLAQDANGRSLLLFLQPDCDDCRDWLPAAASLSQQAKLSPLTGIIPGAAADAEAYREKAGITFEIKTTNIEAFMRAARRTPLLVMIEAKKVARIYKEGSLPQVSALQEAPP